MMKRLIGFLVALIMLASLFPTVVLAQDVPAEEVVQQVVETTIPETEEPATELENISGGGLTI